MICELVLHYTMKCRKFVHSMQIFWLFNISFPSLFFSLMGMRVANVYDVDHKTYLIKLAKCVRLTSTRPLPLPTDTLHVPVV